MYTGTLINDLMATVARAEQNVQSRNPRRRGEVAALVRGGAARNGAIRTSLAGVA